MGDFIKLAAVLAVFFVLIGLVWLIALKLGLLKPPAGMADRTAGEDRTPKYRVRNEVLSPGEWAFWPVLREAVRLAWAAGPASQAAAPVVLASVRLAELLAVDESRATNRSAWQTALNQITSKQVDFVVCDGATTRPLLVVEFDDPTHERADRKGRDAFVDRACQSAGLPIMHVRSAAAYNTQDLAKRIAECLGSKA
ncbi:MAG: DUF2726 domain-containing protein [Phycisphaerales bacterium]